MSDYIPFEIQMEIIKKVSDVKSLIQFRSVSNTWKSFIDSHEFIKGYGTRDTQPHSRMLALSPGSPDDLRCIFLVDDDIETFKLQQFAPSFMSPLLQQYCVSFVVGASHGLLCLYGFHRGYAKGMLVIWNPSIQKAFGIVVPSSAHRSNNKYDYGFGVSPDTSDPTVVKISRGVDGPRHAQVFTLSSGVWNVIPCGKLPRESVNLNTYAATPVVIDGFIYWGAWEVMHANDGETTIKHMFVSFDLITKEFKVVDMRLPDALRKKLCVNCLVSKLRECLVVYGAINVEGATCCGVWVMEQDLSFRKLFTIGTRVDKILGFRMSGEPIFETQNGEKRFATLDLYDPSSQHVKNLGISGQYGSFLMGFNEESLLFA